MGNDYGNNYLCYVVDGMELELDSKILSQALSTVEIKGKYMGDSGLINSSLGDFVKVFAVADGWRTGYYFCNGNNQTFVSYYLPAIIEENFDFVINGALVSKHLKHIKGDVTLLIDDLCQIQSERKSVSVPITLIHPYEQALNTWLSLTREKCIYTPEIGELELRKNITLMNSANLSMPYLRDAIATCESVSSGIYTLVINDAGIQFMSSSDSGEQTFTSYDCTTNGGASISVTSPIHKAFSGSGSVNIYFNNDWGETEGQPLVIFSNNVCFIRAPYIQLEVE